MASVINISYSTWMRVLSVLQYVIDDDRERKDFEEHPSTGHVYYLAYYAKYGRKAANEILDLALNEEQDE